MPDAFVLFKTEPACERDVYLSLTEMDSVQELHALYGKFDILARITAPDSNSLTQMLMNDIRQIGGVKDTQTLIAVDV
jgi:DNA-binding Lrp family transcriptional regulator